MASTTRIWCSYEKAIALAASSSLVVAWPRSPVTGLAPNSRISSTKSTPRISCSAEYASPDWIGRPHGHPRPSGPPTSGLKYRCRTAEASSRTRRCTELRFRLHLRDDGDALIHRRLDDDPGADQPGVLQARRGCTAIVASLGTRCSKRICPSTIGAAGTTRIRTLPASAPSPAGRHFTRAISGAAARVSCSKSSAVTARLRVRSRIGPRVLADSRSSPSTPPIAGPRFSTPAMNGIDDLSVRIEPAATLPDSTAARCVGLELHDRALRGERAVLTQRSIRLAHAGPERDHTVHRVEHEVAIGRRAGGEVLDLLPLGPALVRGHDQAQ